MLPEILNPFKVSDFLLLLFEVVGSSKQAALFLMLQTFKFCACRLFDEFPDKQEQIEFDQTVLNSWLIGTLMLVNCRHG